MSFGIKQKILLVLVGVLALTTALYAGLASYYTDRQNEESAFAALSRDLLTWQKDLQALTLHLQHVALSAGNDTVLLNQLAELITLELSIDDPLRAKDAVPMARTLAYNKAVSLNRLYLVLQTGGFSSIAVYTSGNKLSHYISDFEAGMLVRQGNPSSAWVNAPVNVGENFNFQSWPSWQKGQQLPTLAPATDAVTQPMVSFSFPSPKFAAIEIIVPLQGVVEEYWRPLQPQPVSRIVSELRLASPAQNTDNGLLASNWKPVTLAVLVFRKRIDHAVLQELAAKTDKWPMLFSPDGSHRLQLADGNPTPKELLQKAQAVQSGKPSQVIRQTVTAQQGSFYEALLPWQFDNRTRLILGLTASRDSTLQNIRQTVGAILIAAGLFLALSIWVGTFWVGRFIDPIVALTKAVKRIGLKRSPENGQLAGKRITAEELLPITVEGPGEIGELSSAFNVMIAELRFSLETLEQRVQARTAELRQQTRYLRTLIDTMPLSVWLKDTACRYLITNQANAAACGRTVEDMVGKSDQEIWPPEIAARHYTDDTEVMATRQRKTVEEPIEDVNGKIWMETFRAPVLDEDGTVLGTVGVSRNISERKAAEEAREKALAEAVRLARQRSEFLAQMSHELRTPLNAILGYAQILRREQNQLTKRQASGLATIQESGQHLLNLINEILDLARVEAGKLALYPIEINLVLFLRVVTDIIRIRAEEKSVLFTYHASPDLPTTVKVDDKRLRQVLLNLLGNAVKFTDRGEVSLRVQRMAPPDTEDDGDAMALVRFEVQDSGVGMNAEQQARLFQPFEQVGEMRRREGGTGLGLAISQQLVHLMGGAIQVRSQLGKGSLFWFELNLPVVTTEAVAAPAQRTITGYQGPRKKVLIVDDVPQNRIVLMDALAPFGFDVADAENGQECLDLLDSVKPDLIVMDVMMPVMNGWETTHHIRNLPAFAHLPVIIVTASATSEDEAKSYASGASAFLPKPIEHDLLLKTIGEQLSLQWIYAEPPPEVADEQKEVDNLVAPPPNEIEKLYQLAKLGNMQQIRAQANHLAALDPRYAAFAQQLHTLAQNYQSKAIVALVERYRTGEEEARTEKPPA